jgi:uncharacterized caspase-like protein
MQWVDRHRLWSLARPLAVLWGLGLAVPIPAQGADRALLIGVGQYATVRPNLPGIGLDLAMMQDVAVMLGYPRDHIKVLRDRQATRAAMETALHDWLPQGLGSSDRVLIYFSGHGSQIPDQNGDEPDGLDDVLVPYDARLVLVSPAGYRLEQVLVDDHFGELLDRLPAREILVVVDACHSGTATRTLTLATRSLGLWEGVPAKALVYPGEPLPRLRGTPRGFLRLPPAGDSEAAAPREVLLSAARDDEKSLPSPQGSLFTLALHRAVRQALAEGRPVTPRSLQRQAQAFIAAQVPTHLYHPQLFGNPAAFDEDLAQARKDLVAEPLPAPVLAAPPRPHGAGTAWAHLAEIERVAPRRLRVATDRPCYRPGETMTLRVTVPAPGRLNVLSVATDG